MAEPPERIRAQIEALRASYVVALAGKLRDLEAAAHAIETQSSPAEIRSALATLGALTHQLAGSASTLEFLRLGEAAGELELMCESLLDRGSVVSTEQCAEVYRLLATLKAIAETEAIFPDTTQSHEPPPG
jgi:HPt (histidine-containing phosphotransfer) domain-containing protein